MNVEKYEVVAAAAVKTFRELVLEYEGPPEKLQGYLLRKLDEMNSRADRLLANIVDLIL